MSKNRTNKNKIQEMIKGSMLTIIIAAFVLVTLASIVVQYITVKNIVQHNIENEANIATERIEWAIEAYKNIAEDIGTIPILSDPGASLKLKEEILEAKSKEYGLVRCKTVNLDGSSDMDDQYRGNRVYFDHAIQGETYFSDPIIAKTDGNLTLIAAAPIWKDGIYGGEVTGVVFCSIDPNLLSSIVSRVGKDEKISVRVINSEGTIVASQNLDEVKQQVNYIKRAEADSYFEDFAEIDRAALRGETGLVTVWDGIFAEFYNISEIKGTPGWKYIISVSLSDYLQQFWLLIGCLFIFIVVLCFVITKKSEKIAIRVGEPLVDIADRLKKAAEGDLSTEILTFGDTEEVKTISSAARDLVKRLEFMISDNEGYYEGINIQELLDEKTVKIFQDLVMTTTGLGIVIINSDGKVVSTPSGSCDFCEKYIKGSSIGVERCRQSDVYGCMSCIEKGKCVSYECHMGHLEFATPIMLEGRYIGAILGGQIRTKEIDEEFLSQKAAEFGVDKEGLIRAAGSMRLWTQEEVDRVETVLNSAAEFLTDAVRKEHRQNIKNRKKEKSALLKNAVDKTEKNISSLTSKMVGEEALDLFHPNAKSAAQNLSSAYESDHLFETAYDVRALINDAVGDMGLRTRGKRIDFLLNIKTDIPDMLMGDAEKVSNIISGMIQTAIISTDAGYIRVDVSSIKNGYALFLKVKVRYSGDNKEAMSASDMRKFVDPKNSFSVNNHSSQEIGLIALGSLVYRMDGEIDIKENSGHGISLCVVIPQLEGMVK